MTLRPSGTFSSQPCCPELPQPASRAREASDQAGFLAPHDAPVERGLTAVKARSSDLRTRGLFSYRGRDGCESSLLPREGMRCDDRDHARGSSGREYERPLPRDDEPSPPVSCASPVGLSGAAAMLSTACRSTIPPPFVQHGSPTALTLGPSSGGQHPQFEGTHQVPMGGYASCLAALRRHRGEPAADGPWTSDSATSLARLATLPARPSTWRPSDPPGSGSSLRTNVRHAVGTIQTRGSRSRTARTPSHATVLQSTPRGYRVERLTLRAPDSVRCDRHREGLEPGGGGGRLAVRGRRFGE